MKYNGGNDLRKNYLFKRDEKKFYISKPLTKDIAKIIEEDDQSDSSNSSSDQNFEIPELGMQNNFSVSFASRKDRPNCNPAMEILKKSNTAKLNEPSRHSIITSDKNIFNESLWYLKKFNKFQTGPRYDSKNQIVKRSIIGPVEILQPKLKKTPERRSSIIESNLIKSASLKFSKNILIESSFPNDSRILQSKKTLVSFNQGAKQNSMRYNVKGIYSDKQLKEIMNDQENKDNEIGMDSMNKSRKTFYSDESKLNTFKSFTKKWDSIANFIKRKVERGYSQDTLLNCHPNYRSKLENSLKNDLMQKVKNTTIHEWPINLRNYNKPNIPFITKIISPAISSRVSSSNLNDQMPFTYNKAKNKTKIRTKQFVSADNSLLSNDEDQNNIKIFEEYQNLYLIGSKVSENELRMLERLGRGKYKLFENQIEEEYIFAKHNN